MFWSLVLDMFRVEIKTRSIRASIGLWVEDQRHEMQCTIPDKVNTDFADALKDPSRPNEVSRVYLIM